MDLEKTEEQAQHASVLIEAVANSTTHGEFQKTANSWKSFNIKILKVLKFCVDAPIPLDGKIMDGVMTKLHKQLKDKVELKSKKTVDIDEIKDHSCCHEGYTCTSSTAKKLLVKEIGKRIANMESIAEMLTKDVTIWRKKGIFDKCPPLGEEGTQCKD